MRLPRECYQMQQVIETHLPHLSQPQLAGLALWVCGAILAGSACQNAVASALSARGNWNSLRQYLREWLYDGSDRFVVRPHPGPHLALAVDPTLKGDQTTSHRRQRGLPGLRHSPWPGASAGPPSAAPGWIATVELLQELAPAVPQEMTVIVLCDRGIASPKLWKQIRDQGVASLHEVSEKHHFLCPGRPQAAGAGLRPPAGYGLDRSGYRFRHRRLPNAVAPCWRSGTPGRRSRGSY